MEINELLGKLNTNLRKNEIYYYDIGYILKKGNTYKGIIFDKEFGDDEHIFEFELNDKFKCSPVPDWDFNIDDYLFYDLECNHELIYMDLSEHYNVWCSIDDIKEDIEHFNGLQNYLSFCQKNDINSKTIQALNLQPVNVMDLYVEQNIGYKIIAETVIDNSAIVLGYKENSYNPYVTWRTSPNRKYGYDMGHYFTNYKDAFKDYKERSFSLLNSKLIEQKRNHHPNEKVEVTRQR